MAKRARKAQDMFAQIAADTADENAKADAEVVSAQSTTNISQTTQPLATASDTNNEHDRSTQPGQAGEADPLKQFKDMLPANMNAADKQKLELYDKLYDELKAKSDENAVLLDKTTAYVEQIDSLKSEVEKLTQQLKDKPEKASSDSNEKDLLQKRIDELNDMNSKLQFKVAQQAYKIAALKDMLSKSDSRDLEPANRFSIQQKAVKSPMSVQSSCCYSKNGYTDWN